MKIRGLGILIILFTTIIAFILSISADTKGAGLGGLYNLILPLIVGAISLIIYLLVCWVTKDNMPRILTIIGCCLYLIYIGVYFQLKPGYLPIPFWISVPTDHPAAARILSCGPAAVQLAQKPTIIKREGTAGYPYLPGIMLRLPNPGKLACY